MKSSIEQDKEERYCKLMGAIGSMILPLVSPHDLSRKALMHHHHNNPVFRRCEEQILDLITSNPLTLQKVLNDMMIMESFNLMPNSDNPLNHPA